MINIPRYPQPMNYNICGRQQAINVHSTVLPQWPLNLHHFPCPVIDSDVSVAFDPYLIKRSLVGIMVMDEKYHTCSYCMIEGLMIF